MSEQGKYKLDPLQWLDKYADYLFNFAVSRLSDAEKAADLVQDTFLSALKAKDSFKGISTEKTWLTSILKRKIIDVYRKKSTSKESLMQDFDENVNDDSFYRSQEPFKGHWKEGEGPHSYSLLPEGEFENKELREIIEKCISFLPENLAAVFILKMIDEATSEEICKELDITPSNVWVMMHRARLKLRNCIENNWR
ncbi:MAG: sigma-70 family RNA polymerase sigma factor [Bacteroidales bacterium]|nr:sigma-70 family RNA polymerase sigma factor [Bacteroidales bacterium]